MVRLFPIAEVCKITNLGETTVYGAIKCGKFPAPVQIGGASRWRETDLDAWASALPQGVNTAVTAKAASASVRARRHRGER